MKNESREFEVELELKARVATQDIDDIMCTALEGGITGWCRAAKPVGKMLGEYAHEQIARGGSLMLYDAESSDKWELTLDKFLRGLALAIESGASVTIDAESGYIDTSDVDAECADSSPYSATWYSDKNGGLRYGNPHGYESRGR